MDFDQPICPIGTISNCSRATSQSAFVWMVAGNRTSKATGPLIRLSITTKNHDTPSLIIGNPPSWFIFIQGTQRERPFSSILILHRTLKADVFATATIGTQFCLFSAEFTNTIWFNTDIARTAHDSSFSTHRYLLNIGEFLETGNL